MVQMGDEAHNRNRAGTLMLLRDLLPAMIESGFAAADVAGRGRFIGGNDHFFLNLAMPACKLALDAARDIPGSTMVVAMARNGTDFGIQVVGHRRAVVHRARRCARRACSSATTAPTTPTPTSATRRSPRPPASAASPWRRARPSSGWSAARCPTRWPRPARMHEITLAEHPLFAVPALEFRGTPGRHRRHARRADRRSCRRSTPAWPAGSRAPDRSAPAW